MLLDPVREAFVQEVAQGSDASSAFKLAKPHAEKWKPNVVRSKASTMLSEPAVQQRLGELQAEAAARHHVTVDSLIGDLEKARLKAMAEPKGASAAVSAVMGMAKLLGFLVDKKEHSGPGGEPILPVLNINRVEYVVVDPKRGTETKL